MRPKDEDPIETSNSRSETTLSHPAFAQISASRVSGAANLYGSEFTHQHFISITISRSELNRSLNRDWPFAREELIEVSLSEAQWATFVSTLNHGSGVQCTLSHLQGEMIPGIRQQKPQSERFAKEMQQAVADIQDELRKLAGDLNGPLAKTKAAELRKQLEWIAEKVGTHTVFVANQFDEHMEETTEKAKIEINAYIANAVQKAGLNAIAENGMLTLPGTKGEQDARS